MVIRVVAIVLLLLAGAADAATQARVDRNRIELNESFTLELTTDGDVDADPDLTVLDADFELLHRSELSDTRVFNGRIQRSRTWRLTLRARREGALSVPPITVGSESSEPVALTVVAPAVLPPGEADVFITSEVDFSETYVQAQVLYRIKVYRAAPVRQQALAPPRVGGAETLVESGFEDRNYDAVLNGRTYQVAERVMALFPQQSGTIELSPARYEARVLRDGRITGRKVFESSAHTIDVRPIPPPPAGHPDARWLPATALSLTEQWSREPTELKTGEPITRHVTVSVTGQLDTQIPALEPAVVDGLNVYPDKPDLRRFFEAAGVRGVRSDQYAMIGVGGGTAEIPALELPWFDLAADAWQIASLPPRQIEIVGSVPPPPAVTPIAENAAGTAGDVESQDGRPETGGFWRRIAEILAALWLVTVLLWWWTSRPTRDEQPPAEVPLHRRQARLLKAARKAAAAGDADTTRGLLFDWAALEWPSSRPRSLGAIAARVSSPLDDELRRLSRVSYGPRIDAGVEPGIDPGVDAVIETGADAFDGAALAAALRSFHVTDSDAPERNDDPLPPLMPTG